VQGSWTKDGEGIERGIRRQSGGRTKEGGCEMGIR